MKTKKSRLWKHSIALVLGFMLLLPSVALAKDTGASDNLPKTEVVQIDLNAEIEKALQEDGNLEDGLQVIIGGSEGDAAENDGLESEKEISPRGVDYPVTELYIIGVEGASNGETVSEIVNCGKNLHIASNDSKATKLKYDKSKALKITIQSIGFHLLSEKTTTTGDIDMTNTPPYDYVIGPKGGVKDYKMDYILTPRDTQAEQTVFDIAYFAYKPDGVSSYPEKYHRTLTVNWGDAISAEKPAPNTLQYSPIENYLIGLDNTMEFSFDKKNWIAIPSGVNALYLYNALDYQKGITMSVRYKATDTELPSASLNFEIPGLTRPAPNVDLSYYPASGEYLFQNLTPGMVYDVSVDGFDTYHAFTAPDGGAIVLSGAYFDNADRIHLRLHSTDTEGPSAQAIYSFTQKSASAIDIISSEADADLFNTEDLDMIDLVNEGFVEDMGNGIIAIAYDEENANSKTELISNLEVLSAIAE